MIEVFDLYKIVSSYGFPGALIVFVYALKKRILRWGEDYEDLETRLTAAEKRADVWQGYALENFGMVKTSVDVLTQRNVPHETR